MFRPVAGFILHLSQAEEEIHRCHQRRMNIAKSDLETRLA
jgi:hypothetical protein